LTEAVTVLPALAPASAFSRLLGMGTALNLAGLTTIRLPFIGGSSGPADPI
jgi:hypothetical protein